MFTLPRELKLKSDKDYIDDVISKMAVEMNSFFTNEKFLNEEILILAVLTGALYFAADLTRKLNFNAEVGSIKASSYINNKQEGDVKVQGNGANVKDKVVILLDDICDTGHTFEILSKNMKELGAKEVYCASLLLKQENTYFIPNFSGIVYKGDDWFVGYGMDDSQKYRHLSSIYTKKKVY